MKTKTRIILLGILSILSASVSLYAIIEHPEDATKPLNMIFAILAIPLHIVALIILYSTGKKWGKSIYAICLFILLVTALFYEDMLTQENLTFYISMITYRISIFFGILPTLYLTYMFPEEESEIRPTKVVSSETKIP